MSVFTTSNGVLCKQTFLVVTPISRRMRMRPAVRVVHGVALWFSEMRGNIEKFSIDALIKILAGMITMVEYMVIFTAALLWVTVGTATL